MARAISLLVALALLAGCAGSPADSGESTETTEAERGAPTLEASEPFGRDEVTLVPPDGGEGVTVPVYVAADDETRQRGLMFREHLPAGTGMVFLYSEERDGGFWMKNTLIPLSIAFFGGEGDVRAVLDMEPCEEDPCPTYDPGVRYRGALEVNQSEFDEVGLDEDWTIEAPEEG